MLALALSEQTSAVFKHKYIETADQTNTVVVRFSDK